MFLSAKQDKGGPGKSTITVNLAVYFALNGKDVKRITHNTEKARAEITALAKEVIAA